MKNQYVGDINDYRKYGLLRSLAKTSRFKITICWMLTKNDGRKDGRKIEYLKKPEKWRHYDPGLFDALFQIVFIKKTRNVQAVEKRGVLLNSKFYSEVLTDQRENQLRYYERLAEKVRGSQLVFFDPDNGIEIKSVPFGRKNSSKYLYLEQITEFYKKGYSLLIFQHYTRKKHEVFRKIITESIKKEIPSGKVFVFNTKNVVFFLISQKKHQKIFKKYGKFVEDDWSSQIKFEIY